MEPWTQAQRLKGDGERRREEARAAAEGKLRSARDAALAPVRGVASSVEGARDSVVVVRDTVVDAAAGAAEAVAVVQEGSSSVTRWG